VSRTHAGVTRGIEHWGGVKFFLGREKIFWGGVKIVLGEQKFFLTERNKNFLFGWEKPKIFHDWGGVTPPTPPQSGHA
jgi:hypothetical protein